MSWFSSWFSCFDRAELAGALVLSLIVLAGTAVPLGATVRYSPEDIESGRVALTPPCPYRARTGRPCPTCGITRGLAAANRLRLADAWRYNPWSLPIWAGLWLALSASVWLGVASFARLVGEAKSHGKKSGTSRAQAWRPSGAR